MTDLETRLRATYTAVAEQTSVAPWSDLPDTEVVELRPPTVSTRHGRVGWWAAAAAFVLLAGAVGVVRLRSDPVTAPAATDRSFAIPTQVPTGFGLVGWSSDGGNMIGFPERSATADVAWLLYSGPQDAFISVSSTAPAPAPTTTSRTATLSTGVTVHVSVDETTTLAWVTPSGTAVNISADGVELDELLNIAELVWYATPKSFGAATANGGFGTGTFERWQPPGDRFDGSEILLEGSLQDTYSRLLLSYFSGHGLAPDVYTECLGQTSSDGRGRALLFGPAGTTEFVVTLPDGSVRRQPAGNPPWLPTIALAMIAVDDPTPAFDQRELQVACEVGQ